MSIKAVKGGTFIMQFKENARVITAGGQKVGRIDRVVLDPKSKELTHLVVKKGFLFTREPAAVLGKSRLKARRRVAWPARPAWRLPVAAKSVPGLLPSPFAPIPGRQS